MWRCTRYVWLLLAIALAGTVHSTSPATAKSSRGLVFPQGPVTVSWAQLERTKKIRVCNGGRTSARLDVRLAGFDFRRTDPQSTAVRAYGPNKILKVNTLAPVRAGRCANLSLSLANPDLDVDAGEYPGTIVATAVGLGVIRQKLTVIGPGRVGASAPVSSAVAVQQLEAENTFPSRAPQLETPDLLLSLTADGLAPVIGAGCRKLANGGWSKECSFIGNLYKGGRAIHVYIAGPIATDEGVARLPIRIDGSNAVGDYEGVLDPAGDGKEEEAVKAKLNLSDSVWSAIVALLLGAAIGASIKLWSDRWRLKFKLKQRAKSLTRRYEEARTGAGVDLSLEKVNHYRVEVEEAIFRYSWSTLLFDTDSDGYQQIESSLREAENDIRVLGAPDGLRRATGRLETRMADIEKSLVRRSIEQEPELLTSARALLHRPTYAVGDATARSTEAEKLGRLLETWQELASQMLDDEKTLFALGKRVQSPSSPSRKQQEIVGDLAVCARTLHAELFGGLDDEDLERLRTSGRFEELGSRIASAGGTLEARSATMPPAYRLLHGKPQVKAVKECFADVYADGEDADEEEVELPKERGSVQITHATPVAMPERRTRVVLIDILVLLAAASAAVVGGLGAFYFGKTWGTVEDYLLVIVAGTGSQLLITAVLDRFSTFLHDLSPVMDLTSAKVTVKAASEPN